MLRLLFPPNIPPLEKGGKISCAFSIFTRGRNLVGGGIPKREIIWQKSFHRSPNSLLFFLICSLCHQIYNIISASIIFLLCLNEWCMWIYFQSIFKLSTSGLLFQKDSLNHHSSSVNKRGWRWTSLLLFVGYPHNKHLTVAPFTLIPSSFPTGSLNCAIDHY